MRQDFLSDESCLLNGMAWKMRQPNQEWETDVKILSRHADIRIQQPHAAPSVFFGKFGQAVKCLRRIEATARALYASVAGAGDSSFRTKFN